MFARFCLEMGRNIFKEVESHWAVEIVFAENTIHQYIIIFAQHWKLCVCAYFQSP